MHSGNITDMKRVSQEFSDCGLCNAESTKKLFRENCGLRAYIHNPGSILFYYLSKCNVLLKKIVTIGLIRKGYYAFWIFDMISATRIFQGTT